MTISPSVAFLGDIRRFFCIDPIPLVLMKTPSHLPFSTTLVSPVTIVIPAFSAALAIVFTIFFRSSKGRPSSSIKPADK